MRSPWMLSGVALLALLLGGAYFLVRGPGQQTAPFDKQFIDMMVPHHQGAVAMAQTAQARAEHQDIKDMADAIIAAQEREIGQMKTWRAEWFGSDETPSMDQMPMLHVPSPSQGGGHAGHGATSASQPMTMDMAADVEALRNAPAPFDLAFIDAMIPHHQSAIDAATAAEQHAERQEIKELARAIIADQRREIDQMRQWRADWYPSASATR